MEVERCQEQGVSSAGSLFLSSGKRTLALALLLVAAVVLVYSPVAHNGFVNFDDSDYVLNPHVKAGISWSTLKWAFTTLDAGYYQPLTWLSDALDWQLLGSAPSAHHEVSVLLHAANAVLLFLLLQSITGFRWRSWFVAVLFALHPINVESVAWASQRKNILSMLIFLLALRAYVAYSHRPRLSRYVPVALVFALALLSKSQVITLPFLLLLLDYWPLDRIASWPAEREPATTSKTTLSFTGTAPPKLPLRWIILEKLPLLGLSAGSAYITMKAQQAVGAVQTSAVYSPFLRIETAIISYVRYLGKAIWPTNLAVVYPHPTKLYPAWQLAGAAFLLAVLTAAVLYARDRRYLAVGWFWFLGSLVPMIGLIQVGRQSITDHFAYIPFLGLFISITWLIAEISQAYSVRRNSMDGTWLITFALAGGALLSVLTYRQTSYWRDSESLWTHTIAVTEDNYIAHDTLARHLVDVGQIDQAAAHFRVSLAIQPDDLPAHVGLGIYDLSHRNFQGAITNNRFVVQWAADRSVRSEAYANLGSAYRQLGDLADAKECFETSLKLSANQTMPMVGLGLIAQKKGDFAEAVRQYSRAMSIKPTYVGFLLMAQALEQQGRSDQAHDIRDRVARVCPDLAAAQQEARSLLSEEPK